MQADILQRLDAGKRFAQISDFDGGAHGLSDSFRAREMKLQYFAV
jgi:hypothetical protein